MKERRAGRGLSGPMGAEVLFVRRYEQLAVLVEAQDDVEIIDISSVLRQLLFDSRSLVDAVNTNRLKLTFRVRASMWPAQPKSVTFEMSGIDPGVGPGAWPAVLELNRQAFSKHPAAVRNDVAITIRDVVSYGANAAGGVHLDPNPKPALRSVHRLSQEVIVQGLPFGISQLQAIGRVTLRALEPLLQDVKTRTSA